MNNNIKISAISYYLPEPVEVNMDLAKEFPGKVDEALIKNIGVKSRHIAPPGVRAPDIAVIAAEQLLAETGMAKDDIQGLVYSSLNHDFITPATSCLLQHALGLSKSVATFDMNHGCSGYIYSLAMAKSLINTMGMDNVLTIMSTIPTRYIHPKNLATRLLFGDASAATLVQRATGDDTASIGEFVFGTDGAGYKKIVIRDGWDANPLSDSSWVEKTDQFGNTYTDSSIDMDGPGTFFFIIKRVPKLIEETLEKNNLKMDDIDLFIMHQANYYALEQVRNKLGIGPDRFYYYMETVGNTIQSTIPIALREAMNEGKIKKGSKVLIAGFGTGISWGGTVVTF